MSILIKHLLLTSGILTTLEESLKALTKTGGFKNDRVFNKDIPTEHIHGSKDFKAQPKTQNQNQTHYGSLKDSAVRGRTKRIRKNESIIKKLSLV